LKIPATTFRRPWVVPIDVLFVVANHLTQKI